MIVPAINTPLPGPKAQAIIARDASVVSPSYTRGYPLVIAAGTGSSVEDVDGNVFLDCTAGIAVNSTGHSHPAVVKAIIEQAQKFLHMSGTDFYYEPQVRLAEELASIVPIAGGVRSFFGNSGTEAVEACLKLARYSTGRQNVIAFLGAFHGRTMGALSLTGSKAIQRRGFGPMLPGVYHAPYPDRYRAPLGADAESCADACVDFIEHQLFTHLVSPDEVAAVIVEPIQGEGGIRDGSPEFISGLRALCDKHDLILIFDEVQCGVARTGTFYAYEQYGVVPDILATAKGIGGGFPLGACLATEKAARGMGIGTHGSTYGGNPLAMAAAGAVLDVVANEPFLANVRATGARLRARLEQFIGNYPDMFELVRGKGLMLGVKLRIEPRAFVAHLRDNHQLLLVAAGDQTMRVLPPLVIDDSHIDEFMDKLSAGAASFQIKDAAA